MPRRLPCPACEDDVTDVTDRPTAARENARGAAGYDPHAIEERWLPVWDRLDLYRAGGRDDTRPRKYVLDMFPYPSGDLHMGHAEAFSIGDVVARFWMKRGYNVLHPIGLDGFVLPAEYVALNRCTHP